MLLIINADNLLNKPITRLDKVKKGPDISGPFRKENSMSYYNGSTEPKTYMEEVAQALEKTDFNKLDEMVSEIVEAKKRGARIFTAGNGGSSATASHLVNDLVKGCRVDGREGFSAFGLTDSTALITCLANDFSYEEIFSIMLRTYARPGDLLVVFSGSGNSPNIVHLLKTARKMKVKSLAFGGRDGGKMKELSDHILLAPTDSMEQIEDIHMLYCHGLISSVREKLKYLWDLEVINYPASGKPSYAIFDFDGTLSLVREGWQPIMYGYFIEEILACPKAPLKEEVEELVMDFVDRLTGKQTIFQCIHLAEEVEKYGGEAKDPLAYKAEYLRRLNEHIKNRKERLLRGEDREHYLVPGAEELLKSLKDEGILLYLTSGTDEADVIEEARLLGIDGYFEEIHGATDKNSTHCSKEEVIKDLLEDKAMEGSELICFGDGYVEIELAKRVGSYSFALATSEGARDGSVDSWKRKRLIDAGADCVIPDFSNNKRLMEFLRGFWNEL